MQSKLTIVNAFLALASITLAALATLVWVQPQHQSRVDPASVRPEPRALENVQVTRPYLSRADIDPIASANLFRKEREEYKAPPPPQVAKAPTTAAPKVSAPALPPPNVSLKGVFIANGTRVAFLEGNYSYFAAGNKVQEKNVRRKGYYLGERLGDFKINQIEKSRVSLVNAQGSSMTLQLAKHIPDEMINRKGTHFFHKNKAGRDGGKIEVEKIHQAPPAPRIVSSRAARVKQPTVSPSAASTRRSRSPQAPVIKPPQPTATAPRPRITRPRISGGVTPPSIPTPPSHISGVR